MLLLLLLLMLLLLLVDAFLPLNLIQFEFAQKFSPGSAWGIFVDFAPRVDQHSFGFFWFCVG
jgi:hypothetical protein